MNNIRKLLIESELQKIVNTTKATKKHTKLLAAFHFNFPEYSFEIMTEAGKWTQIGRALDSSNNEYAANWYTWLKDVFEKNGDNIDKTAAAVSALNLKITKIPGVWLYIAVKTGDKAEDFIQLVIEYRNDETIVSEMFKTDKPSFTTDFYDLTRWAEDSHQGFKAEKISGSSYGRISLTHVDKFLKQAEENERQNRQSYVKTHRFTVEHSGNQFTQITATTVSDEGVSFLEIDPTYLEYVIPLKRLMDDWNLSSAGLSGAVFYKNWYLHFNDDLKTKNEGAMRSMWAIPGWCDRKRKAEIVFKKNDTPYLVFDRLMKFDAKAGYPFAWFFYMLHGNRIDSDIGYYIAEAVRDNLLSLPETDSRILLAWAACRYSF